MRRWHTDGRCLRRQHAPLWQGGGSTLCVRRPTRPPRLPADLQPVPDLGASQLGALAPRKRRGVGAEHHGQRGRVDLACKGGDDGEDCIFTEQHLMSRRCGAQMCCNSGARAAATPIGRRSPQPASSTHPAAAPPPPPARRRCQQCRLPPRLRSTQCRLQPPDPARLQARKEAWEVVKASKEERESTPCGVWIEGGSWV